MKSGKDNSLDASMMKWYVQLKSCGVNVTSSTLKTAAGNFAHELETDNFKWSDGWLWRFWNRHGLFDAKVHSEGGDDDMASVESFRLKLHKFIEDEQLSLTQVYNSDETGLYWKSMPKDSQLRKGEENTR